MERLTPEEILGIRLNLEETQEEFAERIGVTRRTVINWENGNSIPPQGGEKARKLIGIKNSLFDPL
jgi:DNA-binding transcriptional regulator YiaG